VRQNAETRVTYDTKDVSSPSCIKLPQQTVGQDVYK